MKEELVQKARMITDLEYRLNSVSAALKDTKMHNERLCKDLDSAREAY